MSAERPWSPARMRRRCKRRRSSPVVRTSSTPREPQRRRQREPGIAVALVGTPRERPAAHLPGGAPRLLHRPSEVGAVEELVVQRVGERPRRTVVDGPAGDDDGAHAQAEQRPPDAGGDRVRAGQHASQVARVEHDQIGHDRQLREDVRREVDVAEHDAGARCFLAERPVGGDVHDPPVAVEQLVQGVQRSERRRRDRGRDVLPPSPAAAGGPGSTDCPAVSQISDVTFHSGRTRSSEVTVQRFVHRTGERDGGIGRRVADDERLVPGGPADVEADPLRLPELAQQADAQGQRRVLLLARRGAAASAPTGSRRCARRRAGGGAHPSPAHPSAPAARAARRACR